MISLIDAVVVGHVGRFTYAKNHSFLLDIFYELLKTRPDARLLLIGGGELESRIRDPKDRPILRAALSSNADLFLSGDKDFLEASIEDPRIISVADFLAL